MNNRALALVVILANSPALAAEDLLPPQIIHEPCEFYKRGQSFTIRAQFYDDSPLFDPKVVFRTQKVTEFRTIPFVKGKGSDFEAVIKAKDLRGTLEYFLETFDENGNGPARYGGPDAPVRVLPAADPPECVQTGDAFSPLKSVDASSPSDPSGEEGVTSTKATEGSQVVTPPVPPAKQGCEADDAPAYCSPLLWTLVGIGVLGAAAGVSVGIWYATQTSGSLPPPDRVSITISAGDVTSVIPP